MSKYGSGQLKHSGGAGPGTKETGAPPIVGSHKGSRAIDPSRGPAKNSGQTATSRGGRGKGSTKE